MTWAEFKAACETLLTVDGSASRQTIGGYNAIILRNGVSDLQRFIPQLRSNQRNTWRVKDVAQEGETSTGTLPDKAFPREAFIVKKTCPCNVFPLVPYQWEYRFDLICDKPRRHEWPYYISIDPSATEFMVYPKLQDDDELWIYWDGFKADYADGDPVRFGDEEALAVSYYMKSHITLEVDKDLQLRREYTRLYRGGDGEMGLRTKLFLDWKERGEVRKPIRPPDPSCATCSPCNQITCCWDYNCVTGAFAGGFWHLKHPTTGLWHKITISEETGAMGIKIYPAIEDTDCIVFDDCVTAAAKGYMFSGGYFHLLNETTGKFIALSVIGAPGMEMITMEPQKGTIGHISQTAFGFRLESCLELRNLDETCDRHTWHTISLVDMGVPVLSIGAGDCVVCPTVVEPAPEPPTTFLSAQQSVSCSESGDLISNISLPPYLSISGNSLILAAEFSSSEIDQATADAEALAFLQDYFDTGIGSGDLVCPEPPLVPPLIPDGCGAWWKADSFLGVLPHNTPIGDVDKKWINLAGNTNLDLEQGTASQRPIYMENLFGTMPGVRFDGVDDFLAMLGSLVFLSTFGSPSLNCTIYIVYKHAAANDNGALMGIGAAVDTYIRSFGSSNIIQAWDGIGTSLTSAVLDVAPTSPRVLIFRNQCFTPNQAWRENVTNKGPFNQSNLGFEFKAVGFLNGGVFFQGDIAEIMAFCAIHTDEQASDMVNDYFKVKYPVLP